LANKKSILDRLKSFIGISSYGYSTTGYSMFIEGSRVITSTNSIQGQINAYNYCPPVASIVNRKAKATLNGKWFLLNQDGSEAETITPIEFISGL